MKSPGVVWPAAGEVELREVEVRDPGPGELRLEAEMTMISPGTERAWWLNLPNTGSRFPRQVGYNFVGRVHAVGAGVDEYVVGDRVVAGANHAAHVTTPLETVLPVPTDLASEEAVFFHMGIFAIQGVRRARIEIGESVAVVGQGLIGSLAMQLSRLNGGLPVWAVDRAKERLEISMACGADRAVNADVSEDLSALEQEGAEVVIEATGAPEPIKTALRIARPSGRVVLLASTRGETSVNFYADVHAKGLTLLGAHSGARPDFDSRPGVWTWRGDGRAMLELLRWKRLNVRPLITHTLGWEESIGAYEALKAWDSSALGVILRWK